MAELLHWDHSFIHGFPRKFYAYTAIAVNYWFLFNRPIFQNYPRLPRGKSLSGFICWKLLVEVESWFWPPTNVDLFNPLTHRGLAVWCSWCRSSKAWLRIARARVQRCRSDSSRWRTIYRVWLRNSFRSARRLSLSLSLSLSLCFTALWPENEPYNSLDLLPCVFVGVCLFVGRITQKVLHKNSQNSVERWHMGHGRKEWFWW